MKTEDFDDAIRNKFESINQKYEEQEIENVYNYVKQNFHAPFWKTYGPKMLYISGIAAMSGLLIWNVVEHKENKILAQTVDSLKNKTAIVSPVVISTKPDTVFVTKYVYKTALKENATISVAGIPVIQSKNEKAITTKNIEQKSDDKNFPQAPERPKVEETSQVAANSHIQPELDKNNNSEIKSQEPKTDIQNLALISDSVNKNTSMKNERINNFGIGTDKDLVNDSSETEKNIKTKQKIH
jgi:uncharacterized protein YlxP (DUF503 family)